MKKFFLLLIVINSIAYGQYKEVYDENIKSEFFKCTGTMFNNCNNGYYIDNVKYNCPNCKNWANSYRNSRGCDVCKNNKYIIKKETIKCSACNGLGKIRNTYYTKEGYDKRKREFETNEKEKEAKLKKDEEKLSTQELMLKNSRVVDVKGHKIRVQVLLLNDCFSLDEVKEITKYTGWRLPTKEELKFLLNNQEERKGFEKNKMYWSEPEDEGFWIGGPDDGDYVFAGPLTLPTQMTYLIRLVKDY